MFCGIFLPAQESAMPVTRRATSMTLDAALLDEARALGLAAGALLGAAGISITPGQAYYASYITNVGSTRTRGVDVTTALGRSRHGVLRSNGTCSASARVIALRRMSVLRVAHFQGFTTPS